MSTGVDFADVAGVSGCGQQHGSVYWRVGARDMLRKANPGSHSKKVLSYSLWKTWMFAVYIVICMYTVGHPLSRNIWIKYF